MSWDIPFNSGEVKVIAYKNRKEIESNLLKTTKAPHAIKATILEQGNVKPGQVCHVVIEVVDEDGLRVMNADNEIRCHVDGNAIIMAMDNADSSDMGDHRDARERVNSGRLITYVKVNEKGAKLKFSANWLKDAEIEF